MVQSGIQAQKPVRTPEERSPRLRALLGYLILHQGQSLERSRVAGTFWPEKTESQARRALNNLLWRLRSLANGRLLTQTDSTPHTIRWYLLAGSLLDLSHFDQLLTNGAAILNLENGLTKRGKEVISCLYGKKIPFTKVFQSKSNGLG